MERASQLILVVDDEVEIGNLAAHFLRRAGYETLTLGSATEALSCWNPEVKGLLTDCIMPDMLGCDLAALLLQKNPQLKVIFMSANTPDAVDSTIPLQEGRNFIRKPFSPAQLIELVRRSMCD